MSRTRAEFTRLLFEWLNQVEGDAELPASAFKIAWRLAQHFDKDMLEGYPGSEHIAGKTKLGKATVLDMVRRLEARGHIAIDSGRPGRGHPHHYRMTVKGRPTDLFASDEKGQQADLFNGQKRSVYDSEKVGLHEIKGRPADMNHLREPLREQTPSTAPTAKAAPLATKVADRDIEIAFEEWWKAYPRRVEKKGAKTKYASILKRGEGTVAELLAGAKAYATECLGKDPRYVKHPTTWLNNGCWADERGSVSKPNGATAPDDAFWRERLQRFRENGIWAVPGPKPGERGCRVPSHILAEFNLLDGVTP
jgi:hypothetical protein